MPGVDETEHLYIKQSPTSSAVYVPTTSVVAPVVFKRVNPEVVKYFAEKYKKTQNSGTNQDGADELFRELGQRITAVSGERRATEYPWSKHEVQKGTIGHSACSTS